MLLRTTLLLFVIAFVIKVQGQQIPQNFQGKTHMLNEQEMKRLNEVGRSFQATDPPQGNIRSIAEFERTEGIIVTYLSYSASSGYFGIPIDLIAEISEGAIVYTVVEDSATANTVENLYDANGVILENVVYVLSDANSYWSRDYSPWFIANDDTVSIVDFPYNRPRPADDDMPLVFGNLFDMDVYGMDLISTGGNYMSDGMGVAASCDLVVYENPGLDEEEVQEFAQDFLGVSNYHLLDDPLDDYIEHIDCWGKFLAVDKILITQVQESDYRYADFELLADYWENQTSSYGNNYEVYRVYSPNGQPYTNSLILNNKVLVPIVTGFGSDYNEQALDVYREALPGYEVIGFDEDPSYYWQSTDALHCRTHEVPDREMLYIKHIPIRDSFPAEDSAVTISAEIHSYGAHALDSVSLKYSVNNDSAYFSAALQYDSAWWYSFTLAANAGDTINYYIEAKDSTGRVETHPFMGAIDPHSYYIIGRPIDTTITDTVITDTVITDTTVWINTTMAHAYNVKVYPNPATDKLYVTLSDFPKQQVCIRILDMNGRLVAEQKLSKIDNWNKADFNLSEFKSGLYFIEITSGTFRSSKKIMVQ